MGIVYSMEMVDKGMIHVSTQTEQGDSKFHYATQNGVHFKTCKLFISGIFQLIFETMIDHK